MATLTTQSKILIVVLGIGSILTAIHTYRSEPGTKEEAEEAGSVPPPTMETKTFAATALTAGAQQPPRSAPLSARPVRVALATWPGHMPLVIGNGGLITQPGSAAAAEGLSVEISFIDDPAAKNKGLQAGELDFIWQTVDELPISLGSYQQTGVDLRVLLQLDWSRGGDACVAAPDIQTAEEIFGRRSAMMLFSPDHTLFEFMLTNSNLTPSQVARVRSDTTFSPDDITFGRTLFTEGKADVACLWEPDVSLALAGRPGAHRLFSTSQATELIADILVSSKELLETHPDVAEKLVRVWFAGIAQAEADRPQAARAIMAASPRFRDELGYERTLHSLEWVSWSTLTDNERFFGISGGPPAFDRAYNQADSIWINYPEAAITSRFVPGLLRYDAIVRQIWEASGRPVAAPREDYDPRVASQGSAIFTKPISISFATGSSALDSTALATVNQEILPQAEMAHEMYLRIEGNTDNIGDELMNQELSERRARAIVDYLVLKGVSKSRLSARGNGLRNPAATNRTPEGRARNRRTDVLFIGRRLS
jgi:outer membrane protein OmpA-like peptidoglycan-associated protein/ABC-type nitrate/sulfonate/bicarbonate transport system substrate-binding protein